MIDWMTELIGVSEKEYPKFMAGLSFLAALTPDDALQALRARADALGFKIAGIRGGMKAFHDAGLPRLFGLESEYEEQQLEAELHFVNGLFPAAIPPARKSYRNTRPRYCPARSVRPTIAAYSCRCASDPD